MADTTTLRVDLFDGARQPIDPAIEPHIQVFDGDTPNHKVGDSFKKANRFLFPNLPYVGNFADSFRVIATAKHYFDAGFVPVNMSEDQTRVLSLMMIPRDYELRFSRAAWEQLAAKRPQLQTLLTGGFSDEPAAQANYAKLMNDHAPALAGILGISAALAEVRLPKDSETTALSFYKQVIWDESQNEAPQPDRFYAWASTDLIKAVVAAAHDGDFSPEPLAGWMHHGASRSYKQVRFGEANVQITFHENIPAPAGLVKVETDIDYYKNGVAHALLEVIPNHFTSGKTDPAMGFALRWMAGKEAGLPEFDPLFDIVRRSS